MNLNQNRVIANQWLEGEIARMPIPEEEKFYIKELVRLAAIEKSLDEVNALTVNDILRELVEFYGNLQGTNARNVPDLSVDEHRLILNLIRGYAQRRHGQIQGGFRKKRKASRKSRKGRKGNRKTRRT